MSLSRTVAFVSPAGSQLRPFVLRQAVGGALRRERPRAQRRARRGRSLGTPAVALISPPAHQHQPTPGARPGVASQGSVGGSSDWRGSAGDPADRGNAGGDDEICFSDECTELYRMPPPAIAKLVDTNVDPAVSLQPVDKKVVVLLDRPSLPSIAEVAAEELRLAGFRINAATYAPSRSDYFNGMSMQNIDDPERTRMEIDGLPEKVPGKVHEIGYVRWAPDGRRFAFCIYQPMRGLELWCLEVSTRLARCVLPGVRLNAVCGDPFTWSADSNTIVAKFVIEDREPPKRSPVPRGPIIQENMSNQPAPSRTFQDLLKDRHDVALFSHYTTCQLGRVHIDTGKLTPLGLPAAFRRASPSPDGRYVLIDAMVPPFEFMIPAGRFPRRVEVWEMETGAVAAVVAEIPLQDKIPIAFDGVGEGPRGIGWRADAPATLYWAEAQDGGDPNTDAEIRDCLFTLPAPFTAAPRRLVSLAWRYNGIVWGSDTVALVSERRYKTRSARSYLIAPGEDPDVRGSQGVTAKVAEIARKSSKTFEQSRVSSLDQVEDASPPSARGPCCARACELSQGEAPRRLVIDVPNWEDRYNDPGSVCTTRNRSGKAVLRLIYPNRSCSDEERERALESLGRPFFLMQGAGASDDGDRPFLGLFDTISGHQTRIWQSSPPMYESVVTILDEDEKTGLAKRMLLRRETPKDNPNFFVFELDFEETLLQHRSSLAEEGPSSELSSRIPETTSRRALRAITNFEHPAPELADVQREIVHYTREDGVRLTANLYLPPGHDVKRDGPLPVFLWAYPREYKSAAFAGQTRGSPYRFVRLGRTPLYWLTCGYAILDGPEMPIIGEGDEESNDTYVPQLVMSAEAAVNFLEEKGIAESNRIAVGGHSYGAFMAVNLLAHAPDLFCCGIARSGAYNRTLTPFGFQSEERTLWQAPEVYQGMSPYMYADRIKAPLLLIHGDADNNPGTFPMQSERLYQALKGHGRITRFVNLPHEGHGYRARESVMHALAEMTEWLDRYTKVPVEVPRAAKLKPVGIPRK